MVVVARHGRTEWNEEGRLQGHGDSPLTKQGISQANLLGQTLQQDGYQYGKIYVSPLGRACNTAKIVADILGMNIEIDANLMEMGFGTHEGKSKTERQTGELGLQSNQRDKDKFHYRLPGGESYADVLKRAKEFLQQKSPKGGDIIIAHEAMNRMLLKALGNLSVSDSLSISQPNDTIYRVTPSGGISHKTVGVEEVWNEGLLRKIK